MSKVMDVLLDPSFSYEQPWFYQNPLALRCELGIGDQQYLANALRRAEEIYTILFDSQPDAFFSHHYISDWDDPSQDIQPQTILQNASQILFFALDAQRKYRHTIVRNLAYDIENNPDIARINRIICYPDGQFDPIAQINKQISNQQDAPVSFVSEKNECIYSIYDDRGCDIVFFSKEKFREFYPLLQPYFLDYDLELMEQRLQKCQ